MNNQTKFQLVKMAMQIAVEHLEKSAGRFGFNPAVARSASNGVIRTVGRSADEALGSGLREVAKGIESGNPDYDRYLMGIPRQRRPVYGERPVAPQPIPTGPVKPGYGSEYEGGGTGAPSNPSGYYDYSNYNEGRTRMQQGQDYLNRGLGGMGSFARPLASRGLLQKYFRPDQVGDVELGKRMLTRAALPAAGVGFLGNGAAVYNNNQHAQWQQEHPIISFLARNFGGMPDYQNKSYLLPSFMQ